MRAELDRQTVKQLNRIDRRRRIKYSGKHEQELGSTRSQTRQEEERDEGKWSRSHYRHAASSR